MPAAAKEGDKEGFTLPPALGAAVAVVVAVLAAVGVSGDLLTRAVRNRPYELGGVIVAVLVLVGATVAWLSRRKPAAAFVIAALTVLLAIAVGVGARSIVDREQPLVTLTSQFTEQFIEITVTASGSGLRSDEDMLVQLQALSSFPENWDATLSCRTSRMDRFPPGEEPPWPGPLLLWEQAGPGPDGTTNVESMLQIPRNSYAGVCAFASLRGGEGKKPRSTAAFLRLTEVT